MRHPCGIDQLRRNPNSISGLAHAALNHIAHAKLTPDMLSNGSTAMDGLPDVGVATGAVATAVMRYRARRLLPQRISHAFGAIDVRLGVIKDARICVPTAGVTLFVSLVQLR